MKKIILLLISTTLLITGCATQTPYDYSNLVASKPRSIVVIPPRNNSIEVNASYTFLSSITEPLAEKGYYVYPVSVIDHFFKENGLPTPAEMNTIPLDKIREHIGADAVLYVTIEEWGQKYQVISSRSIVRSTLTLVDTRNGNTLWEATASAERNSNDNNNNGLLGALVGALAEQIIGSTVDRTQELSRTANYRAIGNEGRGLLQGPYQAPK